MDLNFNLQPLVEKLNAMDLKVRYAVFGLCLLAVVGLDYALLLQFQLKALGSMGEDIQRMSADITRVRTDIVRIKDIQRSLDDLRSRMASLKAKVHSLQEVPSVLENIARTANENGVSIDQLTPAPEGPQLLFTSEETKYYVLPIVVGAHSGYHMFGRFLGKLETGHLVFLTRNLRIEGNEATANNLSIQMTLKVVLADRPAESK